MASDTFWTTQNQTPALPVLGGTPGDALTDPLTLLRGLTPDGARNPQLALDDAALFPRFDGVTNLAPLRPADFDTPTMSGFGRWHAFHQVEFLHEHGTTTTVTDGSDDLDIVHATIGSTGDPFFDLQVVLSADGRRAIILNTLSAADMAALPLADQRLIGALAVFRAHFAPALGLVPGPGLTTPADARAAMVALVQERIALVEAAASFDPGRQADFDADPSQRATLYHYLFTGQMRMLIDRLDAQAIFNPDMIRAEADAILTRFARLERYMSVTPEGSILFSTLPTGVNAVDALAGIRAAREVLTGVEMRLYDLAAASRQIVTTGSYQGRRVDTPDMVFLLQTFQNYSNEADAEGRSEDLKQLQRVLEDYTAFQRMLNTTLQSFDPVALADPDTTEKKGLKGATFWDLFGTFDAAERRTMAMFDTVLANATANSFHPLETEIGLARPTESLVDPFNMLAQHPKTVWDALARNIAEATKALNQDSQIRMDEIARLNRQKNRNYDLASNTLNKMADILRSIVN